MNKREAIELAKQKESWRIEEAHVKPNSSLFTTVEFRLGFWSRFTIRAKFVNQKGVETLFGKPGDFYQATLTHNVIDAKSRDRKVWSRSTDSPDRLQEWLNDPLALVLSAGRIIHNPADYGRGYFIKSGG